MELLAVYTTVNTLAHAQTLARTLVTRRLAACAQIGVVESFYHWDSALQQEDEYGITFKTTQERYPALEAALSDLHPYELPAIEATPITHSTSAYAAWVADNCKD